MRRILLSAALPLFLALTACTSGEEAPDETAVDAPTEDAVEGNADEISEDEAADAARSVAQGFVAAIQARDGEAGCAFVDAHAQEAIIAQGEGQDCAAAFPGYLEDMPAPEGLEVGEVTVSTDLDGDTLIANVELVHADEEPPGPMEVREDADGEWRATRLPATTVGGG